MPITSRSAVHFRVGCDGCKGTYPQTAELCSKREEPGRAKAIAIEKFRASGWHVDGLGSARERWFCPKCAKQPHL